MLISFVFGPIDNLEMITQFDRLKIMSKRRSQELEVAPESKRQKTSLCADGCGEKVAWTDFQTKTQQSLFGIGLTGDAMNLQRDEMSIDWLIEIKKLDSSTSSTEEEEETLFIHAVRGEIGRAHV